MVMVNSAAWTRTAHSHMYEFVQACTLNHYEIKTKFLSNVSLVIYTNTCTNDNFSIFGIKLYELMKRGIGFSQVHVHYYMLVFHKAKFHCIVICAICIVLLL